MLELLQLGSASDLKEDIRVPRQDIIHKKSRAPTGAVDPAPPCLDISWAMANLSEAPWEIELGGKNAEFSPDASPAGIERAVPQAPARTVTAPTWVEESGEKRIGVTNFQHSFDATLPTTVAFRNLTFNLTVADTNPAAKKGLRCLPPVRCAAYLQTLHEIDQ